MTAVTSTSMMLALAVATAGLTGSPEHAQVTTLPVSQGVPLAESLPLLAPTLAWVLVAAVLALRLFRWEPRR